MIESADEGLTWSNPVDITDMIAPSTQIETVFPGGPGGLQLPNGRLILGAVLNYFNPKSVMDLVRLL